jgi:aspartate aminotransferase
MTESGTTTRAGALRFASRVSQISTSPTMAVMAEAMRLRAQGVDVVDFSAGEPDFPTPAHIKRAGEKAIEDNFTRYTPNAGIPELRQAVADRYREDYGLEFESAGVIVTSGGKHALLNLMLAIVEAGDEVVIPTPYWMTFSEQVRLCGGEPILVPTSEADGFRMTADVLAPAISEKTRILLLNFPANPTGAVIGDEELRSLGELVRDRDVFFLWDDTYARLMFQEPPSSAFQYLQKLLGDRFIIAGTASKAYAMTGWRIGWAMGSPSLIQACASLQSHMTSNASSIAQKAALEALRSDQGPLREMIAEYRFRAERLRTGLLEIPGLRCAMPGGGFYLFPNVSSHLRPGESATDLAAALLKEERVAVVPGPAFGCDGHLRVSFATSRERIEEGIGRVKRFFGSRSSRSSAS